jgi:L-amino acid N-acyltransferase YncA
MIIRPANLADAPAVQAIYAHNVLHSTATFEDVPPPVSEMASRIAAVLASGHPWLVAEIEDEVAAYAYASAFRARPGYRFTVEDSVYVDPARTGQGLGRALLARLIEESAARGFRQMIAVIGDRENATSVAMHTACGFTPAGEFQSVGWKFGRWVDSIWMQRALGPGRDQPPHN